MTQATGTAMPDPPAELLAEVAALSRHFGSDPAYTRGGGGNSSGKADGVLYIKPSGVSLATLAPRSLMPLAMQPLLDVVAATDAATLPGSEEVLRIGMEARLDQADHRRPSVELIFHALLPERIVIHTHPTTVNALTCAAHGGELATELFGDEALWIPYTNPGLPLARRIVDERHGYEGRTGRRPPPVMLLQSHGLIVAGSGTQEIIERSAAVVAEIRERIARSERPGLVAAPPGATGSTADGDDVEMRNLVETVAAMLTDALGTDGVPRVVVPDTSPMARQLGAAAEGRAFVLGGPLTPDQIVYAGSWPLLVAAPPSDLDAGPAGHLADTLRTRLAEHATTTRQPPSIVVVEGVGLFAVAATASLADTVRDVYLDAIRVGDGAARLGGIRTLAPEERRFIEDWEAEAYRLGVATAGAAASASTAPG